MTKFNRLNLTSSHGVLSHVLTSPLSDLGSDTETKVSWDTLTEEERQTKFDEVKSTVDSGDTDLDDYKNAFKDAYEVDTTLADDDIIWMVARYEIDGPDQDAVVIAMHDAETGEATGEEADADETLQELKGQTSSLADKLSADDEFKDEMALIIKSKEVIARGPVAILLHLERIWDAGDWAKVPEPGTKMPEKGKPSNLTLWDITPTKRGNRKINVSWYDQIARAVNPQGYDDLEDIKETFKSTDERQINNAQRREFMKYPFLRRKSMLRTFTVRVSTYQDMIKRAVRVRNLRSALKDVTNTQGKHPIGCDFAWETYPIKENNYKGVLLPGNSPVQVFDNLAPSITQKLGESYTVMTFLKFEAGLKKMLASKIEPSFSELAATLDRNKEAVALQKRTNRFKVENIEDFLFSMSSNANYIDSVEGSLRAFKLHIEKKKTKLEDGADPRLMTEKEMELFLFGEMMAKIDPVWTYVKANGYDELHDAWKRQEKLTSDDLLTLEDEAKQALAKKRA